MKIIANPVLNYGTSGIQTSRSLRSPGLSTGRILHGRSEFLAALVAAIVADFWKARLLNGETENEVQDD